MAQFCRDFIPRLRRIIFVVSAALWASRFVRLVLWSTSVGKHKMKEVRRSRRVELMPSPLPTALQRTPLRSNQQTTPTARTSCVGLFAKGDARYLYNIARLEQKYCNPERQKQRHYLVIDCATWKVGRSLLILILLACIQCSSYAQSHSLFKHENSQFCPMNSQ